MAIELLSNCCGAGTNGDYMMCEDCHEHCEIDTRCQECEQDMTLKEYTEQDGLCLICSTLLS